MVPAESATCRPPIEPAVPVMPAFDGGIPGACSQSQGWGGGISSDSWVYDDHGRVLHHGWAYADTGWHAWQDNTLDACGRIVYATGGNSFSPDTSEAEYDYDPDGLLARSVVTGATPCQNRFGYVFDANGEVITVYDPASCTLIEQIDRDAGWIEIARPYSVTHYDLLADGGVTRRSFSSIYGYWLDERFDDQGRPATKSGTGAATSITFGESWTWSDSNLLAYSRGQQGNGCSNDSSQNDRYDYDGGVLVHEEHESWGPWCGGVDDYRRSIVDYTYPDAGLRLGQTTEDGGVTVLERATFDFRGNLLQASRAYAPDLSTWYPYASRNYDCFNSK